MLHFMYFRKFIRFQLGQQMPIQADLCYRAMVVQWNLSITTT